MRFKASAAAALVLVGLLTSLWFGRLSPRSESSGLPARAGFSPAEIELILQHSPLGQPPPDPTNRVADSPEAAALGQAVFYSPRFSSNGKVSCATCHDPGKGFGDGRPMPEGFPVDRNVPTLWNVAYQRWFFWDGRSDSLWNQALKPLENPREHGGTRLQVVHQIRSDGRLRTLYERAFGAMPDVDDLRRFPPAGGPLSAVSDDSRLKAWVSMREEDRATVDRIFSNVGKSIEAYERRLVSRRSRFDVFAEGLRFGEPAKLEALSASARLGLKLFVGRGNCRLCHSGPTFSDGEFHNLGVPPARGGPTALRYAAIPEAQRDPFSGKGAYSDDRETGAKKLDYLVHLPDSWGQVKTPGLRNVARTAPYMHQGQFKTLDEVIEFYSLLRGMLQAGHHERTILLPLFLTREESAGLVSFLESLTDEKIDEALLKPPP